MTPTPLAIHRNLTICQLGESWRLDLLMSDPILKDRIIARFHGGYFVVRRSDEDLLLSRLHELGLALSVDGRWR